MSLGREHQVQHLKNEGRATFRPWADDALMPRKRKARPEPPLCCPDCESDDVDEAARTCRACGIGIPEGASLRAYPRMIHSQGRAAITAQINVERASNAAKGWRR